MTLHHLLPMLMLCILAPGCSIEPPLHLRRQAETSIALETKIDVDLLWQVDWEAKWNFPWNTEVYGPLGYTAPKSICVHIYPLDAAGNPKSHLVNYFEGTSSILPVTLGVHDMLFHNSDSEALQFTDGDLLEDIECTTRIISSGLKESSKVLTVEQKTKTKVTATDPEPEPVILMPDALFSLYKNGITITDNLEEYEYIDGRYVLRLEGELSPNTYIHLFQVKLQNNNERVVGSEGGAALTGTAVGVNIHTRVAAESTASVPMTVLFDKETDQLAARVMTFGIPGCDPYDEANVAAAPSKHFLVINICYFNGTWRNIRVDVTDAIRALPLGGVVNLELDVDDFPPEGASHGGGFEALIDNWQEEEGGTTITE